MNVVDAGLLWDGLTKARHDVRLSLMNEQDVSPSCREDGINASEKTVERKLDFRMTTAPEWDYLIYGKTCS